jgi:O-glycosyl hydrolase
MRLDSGIAATRKVIKCSQIARPGDLRNLSSGLPEPSHFRFLIEVNPMRYGLIVLLALQAVAAERAAYDSNGRILWLLDAAGDLEASSNIHAVLPNGKRIPLQMRRQGRGARRPAGPRQWTLPFELPDGGRGTIELSSVEEAGVRYSIKIHAETALEVEAIEYVLDLPRKELIGGRIAAGSQPAVVLTSVKPAGPVICSGEYGSLQVQNAASTTSLAIAFDQPKPTSVVDRWDNFGRSFRVRAAIARGPMEANADASLEATLHLKQTAPALPPARLTVDASKVLARFHGFGGNFCWNNRMPISQYMLDNLKIAWGRTEMKLQQWDRQRENPGPEILADMEVMKRLHKLNVPYVISIWWLPERFYTDSYEKPRSAHFRLVKGEKWDELLELLGGFLLYAKQQHGVEPDLFSFNEANIGVYVGLTPETHTEAIKRIGAYFAKIGLKTRMLLGDATGPRDTHRFVLEAAADPEALSYVGAIGFHSWGGGSAEQYRAWAEVAEWLNLPLLVTELGVDAAAYYTRSWDSYHYGLREARMTQELLMHARPQGTQFWQFTNDYALARVNSEGKVEPSPRFWLMKHFTDLTPMQSELLSSASDQPDVLITAFRKGAEVVLQILNVGAERSVQIDGVKAAQWQVTQSTEPAQFQKAVSPAVAAGSTRLTLPAKSMSTLTARQAE